MALLLDAGALYAQADRAAPHHAAVAEILRLEPEPLVTSALAVAAADYLILTRLDSEVEFALVEDLAQGTFSVECLTRSELRVALGVLRRYPDLARRRRLLTFDERAFRAVTPLQGGTFMLLPADR